MSRALLAPLPLLVGLALAGAPRPADACQYANCQSDGAVNKPADFALSLPFKSGETVKVLSGYGPNAGSSLHCRAQDSSCANDWHALDLVLPNQANWGKGQPVVAAASGTVIAAGWGTSGWASYGQRVYIQHDYNADGHKYVTMYAHLDTVAVSQGQKVAMGDTLGTLGQSCNEAKSCANFSTPHLHFALHRDSNFGGSGSGGSYGGRATVPEPIDGYSNLKQGDLMTSMNGDEEPPPPPPDMCNAIPPQGAILEDDGPCLTLGGKPANYGEIAGNGGHAYHTALDVPSPDYAEGGIWLLNFEQAGDYELSVFVPAGLPSPANKATYKIAFNGQATKAYVDHAAVAGNWASLGTFTFAAGGDQWVRLGDNYDLPGDNGKRIAIDALKIVPGVAPCECMPGQTDSLPCGNNGEQTRTCDGCSWGPWSMCSDDSGTGDPVTTGDDSGTATGAGTGGSASSSDSASGTGGSDGSSGGGGSDSAASSSSGSASGSATAGVTSLGSASASGFYDEPDSGCSCRSTSTDPAALVGLFVLVGVGRRRRQRS
ncbi:MAG: peptidoglycan DD-metalloendopeptidase family protein [Myxococcales bacterium]|nr:peptidoglycan DD-metalloendopeptidase family protein [Myxococcales bacterium]